MAHPLIRQLRRETLAVNQHLQQKFITFSKKFIIFSMCSVVFSMKSIVLGLFWTEFGRLYLQDVMRALRPAGINSNVRRPIATVVICQKLNFQAINVMAGDGGKHGETSAERQVAHSFVMCWTLPRNSSNFCPNAPFCHHRFSSANPHLSNQNQQKITSATHK